MAKHTTTSTPFKAGETNARAVRPVAASGDAVQQTPQRDAKAKPAAPVGTAEAATAETDTAATPKKASKPPKPPKPGKRAR